MPFGVAHVRALGMAATGESYGENNPGREEYFESSCGKQLRGSGAIGNIVDIINFLYVARKVRKALKAIIVNQ